MTVLGSWATSAATRTGPTRRPRVLGVDSCEKETLGGRLAISDAEQLGSSYGSPVTPTSQSGVDTELSSNPPSLTGRATVGKVRSMPMLDPLATFLMRVQTAGNDVEPVAALFRKPDETTADQRAMADELVRRAHENGYIENSAADRVSVTAAGRTYLDELDL